MKEQTAEDFLKDINNVEKLSAILHEIYQLELLKQGKISKYSDNYEDLSEDVKNLDRALARFIIKALALKEQEVWNNLHISDEVENKIKLQATLKERERIIGIFEFIFDNYTIGKMWGEPEYIKDNGKKGDYKTGHWTGKYINPVYALVIRKTGKQVYSNRDLSKVINYADKIKQALSDNKISGNKRNNVGLV